MSNPSIFESWAHKQFAHVDTPPALPSAIESAMRTWREFCCLPEETKRRFFFSEHHTEEYDPGYTRRTGRAEHDEKTFFHLTPNMANIIKAYNGLNDLVDSNDVLTRFFASGEALHSIMHESILRIADSLERHITGIGDQVRRGVSHISYRYLHYGASQPHTIVAKPHVDRNGFTIHLYENYAGLQLETQGKTWVNAPALPGKILTFPASKMETLTKGVIRATHHRVVAPTSEERTSLVIFIPLIDVPLRSNSEYSK